MINKKIKLLIIINDFYVGGAQRLIAEQIKFFPKNSFHLSLVTLIDDPKRANLYDLLPYDLPVTKINMKHFYNIFDFLRLIRVINKIKPDVVISHLFLSNMLTRIIKPLFRYRVFAVEHNTYINKKKWEIFVDKMLALISEKIIAVSKEVADFIIVQQKLKSDQVVIIPNGISLQPINEYLKNHTKIQLRSKFKVDKTTTVFLSVGRLTSQKNQKLKE